MPSVIVRHVSDDDVEVLKRAAQQTGRSLQAYLAEHLHREATQLRRRDALQLYGGQGVRLALGVIPLLVIAGLIEGFLSPSELPATVKFGLAAINALLLVWYLWKVGAGETTAGPAL